MSWVLRLGIGLGAGLLTCVLLAIFGGGGCSICGGISRDRVAGELSRYVTPYEARMIVNGNPSVKGELLEALSRKWLIDDDARTLLLLHPNFPQARRSELIRVGKSCHYLSNATDYRRSCITDEDVKAMLDSGKFSHYILRQALECHGLSADSYRALYAAWIRSLERNELEDSRFFVISANLPQDVKNDMRMRLSHVRFPKSFDVLPDRVGYIRVRDDWKRGCEFFVLCDDFLGAGSLLEFIEKAKHYDSVEAMKSAVKDKTLYQDSDFGVCRMEYTVL